jgi:hypothetical protein
MDAYLVLREIVRADGLAQFDEAEAVRVVRAAVLEGLDGGLADGLRRIEVGLADFEVDDVASVALHGLRALQDVHDVKRFDLSDFACFHVVDPVQSGRGEALRGSA